MAHNVTVAGAGTSFTRNTARTLWVLDTRSCGVLPLVRGKLESQVNNLSFRGVKTVRSSEVNKDHVMEAFECQTQKYAF